MGKFNKYNHNQKLRAKLTIDEGFAERPIQSIKGFTNEKDKGLSMIEVIENYFSITEKERIEATKRRLQEFTQDAMTETYFSQENNRQKVKWKKDERGNIISPFQVKREWNKK